MQELLIQGSRVTSTVRKREMKTCMLTCMLTQLHFSIFTKFRIPCLGNCATHSDLGLPISINLIKTIPYRSIHRPPKCRQSFFEESSLGDIGCDKLIIKTYHHTFLCRHPPILVGDSSVWWYTQEY